MHLSHGRACLPGLRFGAERHQIERPQRAHEPAPKVAVIAGMLGDTRGDERVRNLEQDRRTAAQQRRHRGVAQAPDQAVGSEIAVARPDAFCMGTRLHSP
jgi:hypothetical protein